MANLCSTKYRFTGSKTNKKRLQKELFRVQNNTDRGELNRYQCRFLATDILGLKESEINFYVRGEFYAEIDKEGELLVSTCSAGVPCEKLFNLLAEKFRLACYWLADETGGIGIWSNDVSHIFFNWEYYIEDENGCGDYFECEADAVKFCKELLRENGIKTTRNLRSLNDVRTFSARNDYGIFIYDVEYS